MKKLLLLLSAVGMIFTACTPGGGLDDDNNGNPTEQPGGGNQGGVEIPADKTQAIKFQDENTKLLCTLHWDKNEDGELSYEEAAAVTDLGTAFKGSSIFAFTELKYFTSLETIANGAFSSSEYLTSITIPDSVTSIGAFAFSCCSSLRSITIPDSVTSIGTAVFQLCYSLSAIYCKYASSDNRCLIVDGVLKSFAPAGLTEYTIPDRVTSIEDEAFAWCKWLTSVTIPDSVTEIGYEAFRYCSSLRKVYCKPTTPPMGSYNMFDNNASGRTICVPRNSVEAYKAASGWSDYASDIVGYDF